MRLDQKQRRLVSHDSSVAKLIPTEPCDPTFTESFNCRCLSNCRRSSRTNAISFHPNNGLISGRLPRYDQPSKGAAGSAEAFLHHFNRTQNSYSSACSINHYGGPRTRKAKRSSYVSPTSIKDKSLSLKPSLVTSSSLRSSSPSVSTLSSPSSLSVLDKNSVTNQVPFKQYPYHASSPAAKGSAVQHGKFPLLHQEQKGSDSGTQRTYCFGEVENN